MDKVMSKELTEYTTEEITAELNKRFALNVKEVYDRRTAITKHIRDYYEVYAELAAIMENPDLINTLKDIDNLILNCVDIQIIIEDGKKFLDACIGPNNQLIWAKYIHEKSVASES